MRTKPMHVTAASVAVVMAIVAAWPSAARGQDRFRLDQGGWKQQTFANPNTPEGKLQTIRKLLAEDKPGQARSLAKDWIKEYDNHPMAVEAYLLQGDAKLAQGDDFKALFDYEYVVRVYPASEQFVTALEREYEIAKLYASGSRRKWIGMRILGASGEAEELFIRIQERLPGSELGEKASMDLADFYYGRKEMTSATDAYDLFLANYPNSDYRERAMLRLIYASLATFKGPEFDPSGLLDAQQRIAQFEKEFPASAEKIGTADLQVRIREMLGLKNERQARWYERRGEKVSAIYLYQRIVRDYPETTAARVAAERLTGMSAPVVTELEPASDAAASSAPGSAPAPATGSTPATGSVPEAPKSTEDRP